MVKKDPEAMGVRRGEGAFALWISKVVIFSVVVKSLSMQKHHFPPPENFSLLETFSPGKFLRELMQEANVVQFWVTYLYILRALRKSIPCPRST